MDLTDNSFIHRDVESYSNARLYLALWCWVFLPFLMVISKIGSSGAFQADTWLSIWRKSAHVYELGRSVSYFKCNIGHTVKWVKLNPVSLLCDNQHHKWKYCMLSESISYCISLHLPVYSSTFIFWGHVSIYLRIGSLRPSRYNWTADPSIPPQWQCLFRMMSISVPVYRTYFYVLCHHLVIF